MPLPFLMNAAKFIADRAKDAAGTASDMANAVSSGAQAAGKAFSETDAGKQLAAKLEDAGQVVGNVGGQVNAVVDSNKALSSIRDVGGATTKTVGGAVGNAAGHVVTGLGGFAQSGHIVDEAKAHYEVVLEAFKFKLEALHKDATKLETQKHVVMGGSFQRFIELFERQKQRMKISEKDFEINLNLTPTEVSQFEQVRFESLDLVKGTAQAVAASAAVGTGAVAFATTMGTAATTGTALSTLSGAAATNAMLAWFGGGAISAGGGGMAVGSMVLGGIFVAPAVGIAALIATSKGHEALTKAHKYEAQVAVACEQLEVKTTTVQGLQARVAEVSSVITGLDQRLLTQLRICEALERNSHEVGDDEKKEFFKAGSLATTLSKVLSAPIFDEELVENAALPEIVANAKQTMQVDGPGAQV